VNESTPDRLPRVVDDDAFYWLVPSGAFEEVKESLRERGVLWDHYDAEREEIRVGPVVLVNPDCACPVCAMGDALEDFGGCIDNARAAGYSWATILREALGRLRNK